MATEVELKLLFPPGTAARVLDLEPVKQVVAGEPRTARVLSRYFDTPDDELAAAGLAVRTREVEARRLLTVKASLEDAFRRAEWEVELEREELDFARLEADAPLERLAAVAPRLACRFETDFARTAVPLALPDGTRIELAVDVGEIRAAGRTESIGEVELELLAGDGAALVDFARRIHETAPFRIESRTKAARGYALARPPAAPAAVKASPPLLAPDETVEHGLRRILRAGLAHLQANEASARDGSDPEGVHQVRVATRRLRAAIGTCRARLPEPWLALSTELQWLARELGPARDWDVFLADALAPLRAAHPDESALEEVAAGAAAARGRAYERVRAALDAPRYGSLVLLALACAERPVPRGEKRRLRDEVRARMRRRKKRVRKLAARWESLSPADQHRLRIRVKKLRYPAELFLGVFKRPERIRELVASLRRLQDELGRRQDVATRGLLLAQLPATPARARAAELLGAAVAPTSGS